MGLVACVNIPNSGVVGDIFYCLATKEFYEYDQITSISQPSWKLLPRGLFERAMPHPTNLAGVPQLPVWIDSADPEKIPRQYESFCGIWIPLLNKGYNYPPANPTPGDLWTCSISQTRYVYTGLHTSSGWETLVVSVVSPTQTIQPPSTPVPTPVGVSPVAQRAQANISWTGAIAPGAGVGAIGGGFLGSVPALTAGTPAAISTTQPSPTESLITLRDYKNEVMLTIRRDGTLIYGNNYTPDAAAKIFWQGIASYAPGSNVEELQDLREKVKYAEDRGFRFPKKNVVLDPKAAWDAAMGVII